MWLRSRAASTASPGAGWTTLARHAARGLADLSTAGQLLLDLCGADDEAPGPAELVLRLLKALQVADRALAQAGQAGHTALYRQVPAERRCPLVVDDARDEAQVGPLLPAASGGPADPAAAAGGVRPGADPA
ncbi:hypothetical protein [Streptomyces sp. NPDC001381]|uniref:hypothetical protein n=1 Tax=Streptomyces sp. NPDC001381 TaxID=3364567 RepID=UPI00369A10CD